MAFGPYFCDVSDSPQKLAKTETIRKLFKISNTDALTFALQFLLCGIVIIVEVRVRAEAH